MSDKKTWPQQAVDAFQDLVLFMQKKWVPSIFTAVLLMVITAFSMGMYILYRNSSNILDVINELHSTPESLQEGLELSVTENVLIEKELTKILLNSTNGAAAMFFKFHDSKKDLQGKHDFYYSGMNEITKNPEVTFLPTTQNIPITGLGQYMIPFLEHKCQTVVTEEITTNAWMKNKFENDGIVRLSACPIYDLSDKYLLGFAELIYLKPNDQIRPAGIVEECLKTASKNISAIISK